MKLGAFTTFTPEYTFPEACKMIKALGYDGVQPRIVPANSASFDPSKPFNPWGNNKGGVSETDFFADPKGALKPVTDLGLEVSSVASYCGAADMDRAVKMAQACGKAGIKNVRLGTIPKPQEAIFDYATYIERARGSYKELVAEAKKVGVRPCLELHAGNAFPGPSGTIAFLKGFSPDDVGVLFDPANMAHEGWEPMPLSLNIIDAYLAEIHVKNVEWVKGPVDAKGTQTWKVANCAMEAGFVNWGEVIDLLKARGFKGWLVEEGHVEDQTSYVRLKTAYEYLKKLLG